MPSPDFDSMNETDAREIIIRPLLARLGYAHGTENNIRTEVPLRYDRAFLGRPSPNRDPPLRGRADYICEVVGYGRFTVEVKAPNVVLSQADVEQAHTYSAHPEIAASHFLLSNGREFRLYATAMLDQPLLSWRYEDIEPNLMALHNVIGPAAIRRRFERAKPLPGKPLAPGISAKVKIVGGEVRYGEHHTNYPLLQGKDFLTGNHVGVRRGEVARTDDGRIRAVVELISSSQSMRELNKLAGLSDEHEFFAADEFISDDVNKPTILQNIIFANLAAGHRASPYPGLGSTPMPSFRCFVLTHATGFFEKHRFRGLLTFDYRYTFLQMPQIGNPVVDQLLRQMPRELQLAGSGEFDLVIAED